MVRGTCQKVKEEAKDEKKNIRKERPKNLMTSCKVKKLFPHIHVP